MNRMDELKARVGELVAKRRELTAEIERIGQLNDPTDGEMARRERQMTGSSDLSVGWAARRGE